MENSRTGFSLTELLVVIAILGLSTLLAMPILAQYDMDAGTTGCRSNLRQIGMIMHTYARDRADGEFPLWRSRSAFGLSNQWPFRNAVVHLATNGYVNETRIWICPDDFWDGPGNDVPVTAAASFPTMAGVGNLSYLFIAGHTLVSPENPESAFMLADESNQLENGASAPGSPPPLTSADNHGADYRNLLYLDGHIGVATGSTVNAIFSGFVDPANLQAVD